MYIVEISLFAVIWSAAALGYCEANDRMPYALFALGCLVISGAVLLHTVAK